MLGEQAAVDVAEGGKLLVQPRKAFLLGRIQNLEQMRQPLREVLPVLGGALLDQILKLPPLENAGVVGKQAEQQPDKINFEFVALVPDGLELVMELPHALGGLDVDRVLLLVGRGYIPGDKAEQPDVFIKILDGEFVLLAFLKIIEAEAGEIGNNDVARKVTILQAGKIVLGLLKGAI